MVPDVGAVWEVAAGELHEVADEEVVATRMVVCSVGTVVRGCALRVGKCGACARVRKGINGGSGVPMQCLCTEAGQEQHAAAAPGRVVMRGGGAMRQWVHCQVVAKGEPVARSP